MPRDRTVPGPSAAARAQPQTNRFDGAQVVAAVRRSLLLLAAALLALAVPATAQPGPVTVNVDLHVISFGNYDVNKGTYTMDLYLHLWYDEASAPDGFDATHFEFMNGRAGSKELLEDSVGSDGVRDLWWRIQANLYSEPAFGHYPFDRQELRLVLEDSVHPASEVAYVPALSGSGLDEDVKVSGWRIKGTAADAGLKQYGFDEDYSRFTFTVTVHREPLSAALRTFLPPIAFMVVSGLSFYLHPSKVGQRITFGTSMLISAVGFHVSQTVSLPALGRLTLFDQIMLSAYAFLAASLIVTALIAHNEDYAKKEGWSERVNRLGLLASLALPFAVFAVLSLVG